MFPRRGQEPASKALALLGPASSEYRTEFLAVFLGDMDPSKGQWMIAPLSERGDGADFFSGVFHAICRRRGAFALISVTRFTAKALPLNERVKSRCKAFTLPHFP